MKRPVYDGARLARRRVVVEAAHRAREEERTRYDDDDDDDGNTKCPESKTSNATHTCETLTVLTVDRIVGGKVVSSFWRAGDSPGKSKRTECARVPPFPPFSPSPLTRPLPRRGRSVSNRSRVTPRCNTFSTLERAGGGGASVCACVISSGIQIDRASPLAIVALAPF